MGGYEQCVDSSHSWYPCEFFSIFGFGFFQKSFHHLPSVTNLFKQQPNHMRSQLILKTSNKWRLERVRKINELHINYSILYLSFENILFNTYGEMLIKLKF